MPWRPMMLRGARVLARCDDRGELVHDGGRVEVRYKPSDGRAYKAAARNLAPIGGAALMPDDACAPASAEPPNKPAAKTSAKTKTKTNARPAPEAPVGNEILCYADGACSGNPGPAGLGVVLMGLGRVRELSEYLGRGTNNIAELTAIQRAAEAVEDPSTPLRVYTDSSYSIGVLAKGWRAKANVELIAAVKAALARLDDVELHYVPGHAGVALNERADQLARIAVEMRSTIGWRDITPKTASAR